MANQTTPRWRLGLGLQKLLQSDLLASLKNLESILNRLHGRVEYPPVQVYDRVSPTASTTINSTTAIAITNATLTVTPETDGKLHVIGEFNAICSVFASVSHYFRGLLLVNGVEVSPAVRVVQGVNAVSNRIDATRTWTVTVTKGVSYTLALYASTDNAGTVYLTASVPAMGLTAIFYPNPYRYPAS